MLIHNWCNLNLKIIFPGSRTRDFTVVGWYNYHYAVKAFIKLDVSCHGVTVVIPTNDREIPVRLPGDIIFRLRLHQNLDPANRRLRVSLKHFMRHFTIFPHRQPALPASLVCPLLEWLHHSRWSYRFVHPLGHSITLDGRTDMIRTLRISWGTQAIDYSWANLINTIPHKLHPQGIGMLT